MRKKGDRVVNGKLVRAEQSVALMEVPAEEVHMDATSKGLDLAGALKNADMNVNEQGVIINIKNGRIEVTMTGFWNGQLLSAAMRSIEKKYDEVRRNAAVWAMRQSQKSNQLN